MDPHDRLYRNEDLAFRVLAGEAVLIHARNREVHVLNETATRVWDLLAEPLTVADLCQRLMAEFEPEDNTLEQDLQSFIEQLKEKGLITHR